MGKQEMSSVNPVRRLTGGIYRLKHHLAGTSKDVGACIAVPEDVKKIMLDMVFVLQQNLIKKSIAKESLCESTMGDSEENPRKRFCQEESEGSSSIFKRRGTQTTINSIFKKSERKEACQEIALFFYNNASKE